MIRGDGGECLQRFFVNTALVWNSPRIAVTVDPVVHDGQPLVAVPRAYIDAVLAAGGLPLIVPVLHAERADEMLEGIDGLLIAGGIDIDPFTYGAETQPETGVTDPTRDAFEVALVEIALGRGLPILGVCRGHQLLNVALGGTLIQHLPNATSVDHRHPDRQSDGVHLIEIEPGSLLCGAVGGCEIGVNSLHHQAVDRVGRGLRVIARSCEDGTVEAIQAADDRQLLGVQWHPELLHFSDPHRGVFRWLVTAAQDRVIAGAEELTSTGSVVGHLQA